MNNTQLIYNEKYKGWVGFLTYNPDFYATLGNKFFTIKDGQVWEHNDIKNEKRNYFYGEFHPYKLSFFVNIPQNEDVIFKNVMMEGNDPWDLHIKTNYTEGELTKAEFNKRESYYYTHFRKNEIENDLTGLKTEGIGVLDLFENNRFYFGFIPPEINTGDKLFGNNGTHNEYIGIITEIGSDYIQVTDIEGAVITGGFYFSTKDSRVEGSDLRGYYAQITITNDNDYSVELFAVNTNIIKSYV